MIYNRLFRLSYGEGKETCQVGMAALGGATGIKSSKTIRKALDGLIQKGHIAVVDDHHYNPTGGTTYQVFLPRDIDGIESDTEVERIPVENITVESIPVKNT